MIAKDFTEKFFDFNLPQLFEDSINRINEYAKPFLPYNVIKTTDGYEIEVAVAGYSKDNLEVRAHDGFLSVKGNKNEDGENVEYTYKGLSNKNFKMMFPIAPLYTPTEVVLKDGLLRIRLEKNEDTAKLLKIKT